MLPQADPKEQKKVNLFIKLSQVTGFITKKESLSTQHRLRTTMGRARGELQDLIRKHHIDPELAKMLWTIVQKAPVIHQEKDGEEINVDRLNPVIQRQVFLAEELVKNNIVPLQEINGALMECQENPSLNLGQILLRKRLISSEQFVEINRKVQAATISRTQSLTYLSLKQHDNKIYLNNSNVPQSIGNYEIIREIARGGMGVVYQAKDPDLDKIVALKTIIAGEAADSIDIERFRREAKLTSQLEHPNIVKIHEVGLQENLHYYTMDFVDGVSLSDYVKENKPSLRKLLKIILQVAQSLGAAHTKGIIHRDIKPSNVLVDKSGKPFLTDFGLARQKDGKDGLTMSGVAIGTPAYMSPEQAEGRIREIDQRSDIYSLGAVFYELLCGKPPFSGNSLAETLQMILTQDPIRLKQEVPNIPLKVETICLKCLKKTRNQRYPNAKALIRDIERFLKGDEIKAKRSVPMEALSKMLSKNKSVLFGVVATSLLFCVVVFWMYGSMGSQQNKYDRLSEKLNEAQTQLAEYKDQVDTLKIESNVLKEKLSKKKSVASTDVNVKLTNKELANLFNEAGVAQMQIGRNAAMSLKTFDRALACNPQLWYVYLNKARALTALKKIPEAIDCLNIAIKNKEHLLAKDVYGAYDQRGFCYYLTQQPHKAMKDIEQCFKMQVKPDLYHKKALVQVALGQKQEALNNLNKAIQMQPSITFIFSRGKFLFDNKKFAQAKLDLMQCKRADPNFNAAERERMLAEMRRKGFK
ncbi:serine/threonine-protein kinase [Candidatus Uabimicrobium amorphum]|uniref:non-specific serine/threonine protein kinase n=1 Tax=Uabimicrobium amorphum TaxID=2596890 RepID=A0A5S9F3V1_UABAM|nr:serine/threonine-protein kinase [Candidatus Uabimicrobium amorphum]BBM85117.1 protein kinase [Candidatus Uabimicrobium amorphum]